ncbi:hypothetical protein DFH06DRAFT_563568 [Mycena polygramma]|nr:hypothetical protein DFH06DRAFT_563568 [Mycena polygramma]
MPLFTSASGFQIQGGTFIDNAGDINIHSTTGDDDSLSTLELVATQGPSRTLAGAKRNGRQGGAARMLPYDVSRRPQTQSRLRSSSFHNDGSSVADPPCSAQNLTPYRVGASSDISECREGTESSTDRLPPADFGSEPIGQLVFPWDGPPGPHEPRTTVSGGIFISGDVNHIQRYGEPGLHILHRAVARDAFHDSAARYPPPKCHPETRTEMLEDLYEWSSQTNSNNSILWLHGPAGAGKSAIAQSFCQRLETEGRLGAGFFFKRGSPSRGSGNKLFPTIAYQLAIRLPDFKRAISQTVEDDPSLIDRALPIQLQRLILEPYQSSIWNSTLVVVIDGLDECEAKNIQQEILLSLGSALREQPLPFRVLLTSRPEPHIYEFLGGALKDCHLPLNIELDVQTYLEDHFSRIHQEHWETMASVAVPWPSSTIIKDLVEKSSGYFVYAATIIRFIDDKDFRPTQRLEVLTGINGRETPFAALDQLYTQILSAVPASRQPQLLDILSVIAAKFDLSIVYIEQLLELQPGDVRLILRHLHSVLDVPHHTLQRITVHHASFLDFLDDPTRSGAFHIGDLQRKTLVHHILKTLTLDIDPSSDHVAWQLDQVELEYVTSVQPSPNLVGLFYSLNPDFLVFPNVRRVACNILSWLRRSRPLPHALIQLWEDYRIIVTSGRLRTPVIAGEPERSSAQLIKSMFLKIRGLLGSVDLVGVDVHTREKHLNKLAEREPSIAKDLASCMHNLGCGLSIAGRHAEAMQVDEEAVQLRRQLAKTDPSVTKDLANSLYCLGYSLRVAGRHQNALSADAEAVGIRRRLVGNNPSALAESLENLALNLNAVGHPENAASVAEEAVRYYSELPDIAESERRLANILVQRATYLRTLGRQDDSVQMHQKGAELHRKLSETDPESTAELLCELADDFSTTGLHEDALSAAEKSIKLYLRLTSAKPALTKDLITAFGYRAKSLRALGREEDAVRAESEVAVLQCAQSQLNEEPDSP